MKIRVGAGSCGIAAGAIEIYEYIKGNTDFEVTTAGCIGLCYLEPLILVENDGNTDIYVKLNQKMIEKITEGLKSGEDLSKFKIKEKDLKVLNSQTRIVLENCGYIDPENIDEYTEKGGYESLKKVCSSMDPMSIIDEIKDSGLRGRGGAGFPTWLKWDIARASKGENKYIICNADEGDPGAFMDRSVLEGDPHSLIEGMIIGGIAMGCTEGIVYVRAEYPLAIERLNIALAQAREKGFLGEDILETKGFSFDIRIKTGAGAFVCGEETALISSLEGKRGMPNLKPPYPAEKGYLDMPSNINNVETLGNIPKIMAMGGKEFASHGYENSRGTKVFALAGKIKNGGLVEVPFGITIDEIINDIGGGVKDGKKLKGVQLGGPSGGCVPASLSDVRLDYEEIKNTGAIVGSGGMIVMDEDTCIVDMARYFLDFTVKESCGKCTHCRIGNKRLLEILERITEGNGKIEDLTMLENLSNEIVLNSMCGLGQTAPNPVLTGLKYFMDEFLEHIEEGYCRAGKCKALTKLQISEENCKKCGLCLKKCPQDSIIIDENGNYHITENCINCGLCQNICKFSAIKSVKGEN
ncbi:MAG: NADH-quinone oxidoreductase subunit NuoF [Firmicutes bacterium]|nr:NADH-quinone oxidoreductase subunit NuoF [Bacillota bacterium]